MSAILKKISEFLAITACWYEIDPRVQLAKIKVVYCLTPVTTNTRKAVFAKKELSKVSFSFIGKKVKVANRCPIVSFP